MFRPRPKVSGSRVSPASCLAASAVALLAAATIACSAFQEDAPVRFVRNTEDAGGCTKVSDVAAAPQLPDDDVVASIAREARKVKADTVVLAKGERKGAAYRCEAPKVAEKKPS